MRPGKNMKKRISIVGAGTSGYLSVLYFCTKYPDYDITWIYPENNVTIGVGEGTVPQVTEFLKDLGITFKHVIEDIGGSLKLGIKLENFLEEDFFHPFGGPDEETAELVYIMENNKIPENIESYDISFHFSVANLAKFLDKWFERFDNLKIERRTVNSVDEVDCDWLIDCTGFRRSFINNYFENNFVPIDKSIPNNKAFVYRAAIPDHKRFAYTTCIGMKHGWIWNIPLKNEIGMGYVHDDRFDVKEEFLSYLEQEGFGRPEVREVRMVTGRNKNHFKDLGNKKIVSVGLSSAFLEPLEATGLYFTVFGIQKLDDLIHEKMSPEEYNTALNYEFDVTVDFIVAHYKFSHHTNEYWNFYKNVSIELYRPNNAFPIRSWGYILRDKSKIPKITDNQISKLKDADSYYEWYKKYFDRELVN